MLRQAEREIVCVAHFIAKPGNEDELLRELHNLIAPTHMERGCIRYELNRGIDDPRQIAFIEKFASREDFDFHCSTPYIKGFFESVAPRLVESQVVTLYKEIVP
jgi:quinol monooxygenase YgiN